MTIEAADPLALTGSPPPVSSSHLRAHRTVVRASGGWEALNLRSLWQYRELIYYFTWRDIKVRYKQTTLGFAWTVVQPLITMIIFTVIFGHLAHLPSQGIPYPLFVYVGLLPWTYFQYVLTQASATVVGQSSTIGKVYFPRLVLPLSPVFSGLVDFCASLSVLVVLFFIFHAHLRIEMLFVPLFLLLGLFTALSVGIWFSALNVEYRDTRYILPLLTQIWMYASPVAYSSHLIHGKLTQIYNFNPMAAVINGFRWSILGTGNPPGLSYVPAILVVLALLVGGLFYFRRMEQTFADVV